MAIEQLIFDIITRDRASDGFLKAGKAASEAAGNVDTLTKRLDEVGRKSATARVGLKGNPEALAALDKIDARLVSLDRRTASPNLKVEGAARAIAEISALDVALDKVGGKSGGSAEAATTSLAGMVSPMAGLVVAGIALSPIIATVGIGTLGFGAAAAGAVAPIMKASSAAGGLAANMSKLNPEQRALAVSILGLGKEYDAFQQSLQPEVVGAFNTGIKLAGNLMHDVQPVAKATGGAIDTLLTRVDQEFQSGTWKSFFTWMAANAGPDMNLLADSFINMMNTLPPLLRDLQPIATALLGVTDGSTRLLNVLSVVPQKEGQASAAFLDLGKKSQGSGNVLNWFSGLVGKIQSNMVYTGKTILGMSTSTQAFGQRAYVAAKPTVDWSSDLDALAVSLGLVSSGLLTTMGDQLSWQQSLLTADAALKTNKGTLSTHTQAGLADRQAILQTTDAALKYGTQQLKSGKDITGATATIRTQITWLEVHGGKSRWAADQIAALRLEEQRLNRQRLTQQNIKVSASGTLYSNNPGTQAALHKFGLASGGRLPGFGGGDRHLRLLESGEAVVDKYRTQQYAPVLKAMGVPGMASGGLVSGHYSGTPGGAASWLGASVPVMRQAETTLMGAALGKLFGQAMTAAQAAALAGAGGSGVTRWAPLILRALAMLGQSSANLGAVEHRMNQESGGNPYAINNWDINARMGDPSRGLMQTIMSTFQRWRSFSLPDNIYDPMANIFAGLNYAEHAYPGRSLSSVMLQAGGYDQGGHLPPGLSLAWNGTGRPEPVGHGMGAVYNITVNMPFGSTRSEVENGLVKALDSLSRQRRLPV